MRSLSSPTYPAIYEPQVQQQVKKSANKRELKAQELLFGLIELYIQQGKPIGSQTLKQHGFASLSSATIRNYFAWLDEEGYLEQVHTSGGRIPTDLAWRRYFDHCTNQPLTSSLLAQLEEQFNLRGEAKSQTALYDRLSIINDTLAKWTRCASLLLTPSFESDSLTHVKLWPFQVGRWVALTRSQMGFFQQELISLQTPTQDARLELIEQSLQKKIRDPLASFEELTHNEQAILQELYTELMLRHLLQHTGTHERVWLRSGLSQLLNYPEFSQAEQLAEALHFFEHRNSKEKLMQKMQTAHEPMAWIGIEMQELFSPSQECSLIACPFFVHQQLVGILGIIGPKRIPYQTIKHTLEYASKLISHFLTREYYTYKLAYQTKSHSSSAQPKEEL